MTDKEIIEICAEICGIKGAWGGMSGKLFLPTVPLGSNFDPLTDANDERLVLEAVRKWDGVKFRIALKSLYTEPQQTPSSFNAWRHWFEKGKVGDIARAAAKAWKETK